MPQFMAPGVLVEEAGLMPAAIDGVGTSTAAFCGPTAKAPLAGRPDEQPPVLGSWGDFEASYGGLGDLVCNGRTVVNHVAHAARLYFLNGGKRLLVAPCEPNPQACAAALQSLEAVQDLSILAIPGCHAWAAAPAAADAAVRALLAHVDRPQSWRFAVLDAPPHEDLNGMRNWRAQFSSSHAALYAPHLVVANPAAAGELLLPPSGCVCGVMARTDMDSGVWKAPADAAVQGALRCQRDFSSADLGVLNASDLNMLRTVPGKGLLVWGARTLSPQAEWKYVSVRRYADFVQASLSRGTAWAAFEPSGQALWARLRQAAGNFLHAQWLAGALMGSKAEQAYFVRCDGSTMTQADMDAGRAVVLLGMAMTKPAEFTLMRLVLQSAEA